MPKTKLHEEFIEDFKIKNKNFNNIEVIGKYVGALDPIECRCLIHNNIWNPIASSLLTGSGCDICAHEYVASLITKSHEQFLEDFSKTELSNKAKITGTYINNHENIECKCTIHDELFFATPASLLKNIKHGCKTCLIESTTLTTKKYLKRLKDKSMTIIPIEDCVNSTDRILHRCQICGYEFNGSPASILYQNSGCPMCNPKSTILIVGKNSMWDINPIKASYLLDPENGYKYTQYSSEKLDWKCNCGTIIKGKSPSSIIINGDFMVCRNCSDNLSQPNKFLSQILTSLNVDFETEQYFDWCKFKFRDYERIGSYDFVFSIFINDAKKSLIFEMDGGFHYNPHGKSGLTLDEVQFIDSEKNRLAVDNGYEIIRIDCDSSEFDYMKTNIQNSKLSELFDLSALDWEECYRKSCNSKLIDACKIYSNGEHDLQKISNILKVGKESIRNYLKRGNKLNLCNYIYNPRAPKISVICLNNNMVFETLKDATNWCKERHASELKRYLNGSNNYFGNHPITGEKLAWMTYNEYLKIEDKNIIINKIDYANIEKYLSNEKIICLNNEMVFQSLREACDWCGLKSRTPLYRYLDGKSNFAGINPSNGEKLAWMLYDDFFKIEDKNIILDKILKTNHKKIGRSVKIICLNNNVVFNSVLEASRWANLNNSSPIFLFIRGKRKSAGKHPETNESLHWAYFDPEIHKNYTLYTPQ